MSDDPTEAVNRHLSTALMVASQAGAAIAAARRDVLEQARKRSAEHARELQFRLDAQRSADLSELRLVQQPRWWDTATPTQIAGAHELSYRWPQEPEAQAAHATIGQQVYERFGLDIDNLSADRATVLAAAAELGEQRATETRLRARADENRARAEVLLAEANAYDTLTREQRDNGDDAARAVAWEGNDAASLEAFERAEAFHGAADATQERSDQLREQAAAATAEADWNDGHADRLHTANDDAERRLNQLSGQQPIPVLEQRSAEAERVATEAGERTQHLADLQSAPRSEAVPHDIDARHATAAETAAQARERADVAGERAGGPDKAARQSHEAAQRSRETAAEWNNPERIARLREGLTDRGIEPGLIQKRLVFEQGQKTSPAEAVNAKPTFAPKAQKARTPRPGQGRQLGR